MPQQLTLEEPMSAMAPSVGRLDENAPVRMIVVDDDVTVLGLIEAVLANETQIHLEAYHDSQRALERIRTASFDVMISDLKMPRVDGLTLLHELRSQGKETLVIIVTGYATMESCLEAIRLGAHDYMTKPFRMDEFLHIVRKAVERVCMKRHARRIESQIESLRAQLAEEREESLRLRAQKSRLEEENMALQQLLQRAGGAARPTANFAKAGVTSYPRFAERPMDRMTREMERLARLEASGAISSEEAERARRKIQEAGV